MWSTFASVSLWLIQSQDFIFQTCLYAFMYSSILVFIDTWIVSSWDLYIYLRMEFGGSNECIFSALIVCIRKWKCLYQSSCNMWNTGPLPHHIYTVCLFHCTHFYGFAELCYDFNLHLSDTPKVCPLCLCLLITCIFLQRTSSQFFAAVLLGSLLL